MTTEPELWKPVTAAIIPANATSALEIASCAQQLSKRDIKQIAEAYNNGSYEMMSSYVWSKAQAAIKKQLASLGMEFIGEMLGRPDISEDSPIETAITSNEAISLAQDLGIVNSTEAMRLKQCVQTVTHFASLEGPEAEEVEMTPEEALHCLRTCVQTILGHSRVEVASEFASFRRELEMRTFKPDDRAMVNLDRAPYFFQRTTLSVLLAMLKTKQGAQLEHAIGNINIVLPLIWRKLRDPQKWQTGQTYAEVTYSGKKLAATGLQKALIAVKGFDFVPETLRSDEFSQAAKDVLEAHSSMNNFYNEPQPMRALASMGTTIPMPAFPICLTATLSVRLGNPWGHSFAAQDTANHILNALSENQWTYYINECLPIDRPILEKLAYNDRPRSRWIALVREYSLAGRPYKPKWAKSVVDGALKNDDSVIRKGAIEALRSQGYDY